MGEKGISYLAGAVLAAPMKTRIVDICRLNSSKRLSRRPVVTGSTSVKRQFGWKRGGHYDGFVRAS